MIVALTATAGEQGGQIMMAVLLVLAVLGLAAYWLVRRNERRRAERQGPDRKLGGDRGTES